MIPERRATTFNVPKWPSGRLRKRGETDPEAIEHVAVEKVAWVYPDAHGCETEAVALANDLLSRQRREREEAERQWAEALRRAGLTGQLAECTFQTFAPRADWPGCREVVQSVLDYAKAIMSGQLSRPWLVLWGNYGTGKTHLMAATVHWALKAGWRSYFRSWPEYLRNISATFSIANTDPGDYSTRRELLIQQMSSGQLVAIDDIDKRRPSAWSLDMVYEPLNIRYNESLPTILAFNTDPTSDQAASYIGRAIMDRMFQMAYDFVEFDGPSLRQSGG
jgi:DNA replication protein DnaC